MLTATDRNHATWRQQHPELRSVYSVHGNRCYTFSGQDGSNSMLDDTMILPPSNVRHQAIATACSI